jgi:hypothetical protein
MPEPRRRLWQVLFLGCLVSLLPGNALAADTVLKRSLALDGKITNNGESVEFNWSRASGSKVGRVSILRRELGQSGRSSWQDLASVRGFARIYEDKDFRLGVAYEYQFFRPSKEQIDTGYWVTGLNLPAEENRGMALLVVDESIADDLAPRLDRFMLDLAGDGWKVVRHDVPRGSDKDPVANLKDARKIRGWVRDQYNAAFYVPHALILVGRVPVVRSGKAAPDGHKPRPLETDLFYADTNAIWLDDGLGVLIHNRVPGDHIEMQVGRIDFSRLGKGFADEVTLLKRYFDKNHNWRHGRQGDLRQAYGNSGHLFVERNALRNIVGPDNVVSGGHHDAGTRQPWLLGIDFGNSGYEKYTSPAPIKAVFTINFGSGKLDFSRRRNTMKALMAQPWYVLSTGWGGRPAWQMHHLALGKSIGYSHLRTVNNGAASQGGLASREYTPTGNYDWVNPIWVNLLGDPTLRPFPPESVRNLRARKSGNGVQLGWDATNSEAGVHYRIYRAADRFGTYQALNPTELHGEHRYVDTDPVPGAWYMVRAHSLVKVHAGSFYRFSQGAFASVENTPPRATDQLISTSKGQPVEIRPTAFDPDPDTNLTVALIRDSEGGRLVSLPGGWSFIPDIGFTGRVDIPFTVFDGTASDDGLISIDVTQQ